MNDITETRPWGSCALVSYIPDPLGSFLHGLRQALPGEDNSQPHITILPPRPLKLPVEVASQMALKILLDFPNFDVELSKVRAFPETNLVYLEIGKGKGLLDKLHAALDRGALGHAEEFDFRPHLTLGGPVDAAHLAAVRRHAVTAWNSFRSARRFVLDEIVFLWVSPDSPHGEWHRLWSHKLSTKETTGARAAAATVRTQTC